MSALQAALVMARGRPRCRCERLEGRPSEDMYSGPAEHQEAINVGRVLNPLVVGMLFRLSKGGGVVVVADELTGCPTPRLPLGS